MALKRLPNDVQSLLSASSNVNNFKRAVEELVYNSVDAESTSIAIRINIQEGIIQVIDNGCGITKNDFNELGQRYMTSKVNNISTLKSAPKNYGFRGEFLANIITVSQTVKITSRNDSTEDTWAKTFYKGKEKKFTKMTTRPTKGTTVDIKGFLHNLHIQKSTIDPINDQQNIKTFLEQLSLVHNDISLSLRDDSKNEILFKIHKKRDIYQTLLTLFNIEKADVLELQVEKNEYKVKALIGKTDCDLDMHWIYLNRKFIHSSSKLHKIINDIFKKVLLINDHRKLKHKKNDDENNLFKQNVPFYFAFVTCPYIDYDINNAPGKAVIEFENWDPVKKLLEKLVKFYVGDMNLKEVKKPKIASNSNTKVDSKCDNKDTRNQVEIIMKKILGINSKKIDISQLQNGVKGKLIKRRKKSVQKGPSISKLLCKEQNNDKTKGHEILRYGDQRSEKHLSIDSNLRQITEDIPVANNVQNENLYANHEKDNQKSEFKEMSKNHSKHMRKSDKKESINNKKHKSRQKRVSKKIKLQNKNHGRKKSTETDLVHKRSKIIAQKAEEFLRRDKRNGNKRLREDHNTRKDVEAKFMRQIQTNYENIFTAPKNRCIDKRMLITYKPKPFKTTYDLLQTILTTQREEFMRNKNISKVFYGDNPNFNFDVNVISSIKPKASNRYTMSHKLFSDRNTNVTTTEREFSTYFTSLKEHEKFDDYDIENVYNKSCQLSVYDPVNSGFINNSRDKPDNNYSYQKAMHCTSSDHLETKLTYESHHYYRNKFPKEIEKATRYAPQQKQNVRFITKQSEENFASSNIHRYRNKKRCVSKRTISKKTNTKQVVDHSSYTIEYSESNVNEMAKSHEGPLHHWGAIGPNNNNVNEINSVFGNNNVANQTYVKHTSNYKLDQDFGNTYTVSPSILPCNIVRESQHKVNNCITIQSNDLFEKCSNTMAENISAVENQSKPDKNDVNIIFVSKSQGSETEIEPLNVCETVLPESDSVENEFNLTFYENNLMNDSLYNNLEDIHNTNMGNEPEPRQLNTNQEDVIGIENVSHHFSCVINKVPNMIIQDPMVMLRMNEKENNNEIIVADDMHIQNKQVTLVEGKFNEIDANNFNFKNRLRFVPKGMSQIFENCRNKNACNYILDEDYYEDSIYNNFVHDVQVNTEIYEPKIQNVDDLTTRDIHKFQNKVQKNHASLTFDEKSLRNAKVLGQADCKFIAAIVAEKCLETEEPPEYLVLFDQHAVHERIRLENNLAEYISEDRWKSTPLDNVSLKLSKDEILYLHNYKDKFTQLGLQWTILNENEITINSIPKAILGKNPREVVKVIKAVKNLIVEEINVIKIQKGCLALYPKSIMELVFSEACRYAIKFGDHLSKTDCVELIKSLSACKTPFQCAHGRPVMAVIMDIKCNKQEYKINKEKLSRFRSRHTKKSNDKENK